AHIGATAEGTAASVQDRDFGFEIEIEAAERLGQLTHHLVADRVELVGTIQRDGRDLVRAGVFDEILFVRIHHSLPRAASMGPNGPWQAACEGRRAAVNATPPDASRIRQAGSALGSDYVKHVKQNDHWDRDPYQPKKNTAHGDIR